MDLWAACRERLVIGVIAGEIVRVIESQEQVATSSLVDDLADQSLLEDLIERTKPPLRPGSERLHYLLAAPFRYPPLRHGSRFGTRHQPSLFYGSRQLPTALTETAYYRFVFWLGMSVPPPAGRLLTQHTSFAARYHSARGVQLQAPPCAEFRAELTDPEHYSATQALGNALRAAGVETFEYLSARDREHGINIALISPAALRSQRPSHQEHWLCETTADSVRFRASHGSAFKVFALTDFLVDRHFPQPAS
jgi:hypothetical protein